MTLAWRACVVLSLVAHGAGFALAVHDHGKTAPSTLKPEAPARTVAGETFEVPLDEVAVNALDRAGGHPDPGAEWTPVSNATPSRGDGPGEDAPRESHPRPQVHAGKAAPVAAGTVGAGDGDRTPRFGAVGDRSAVEVATAFTRGFPQAASADPLWIAAPFGPAGTVDVYLTLGEDGALERARTGGSPSHALAEGVRRTLALVRARSFVAEGRETHLRVTATVTRDAVHDGLHGEVFAIGGSFDTGERSGFFALAVGRRIDVRVQVVR